MKTTRRPAREISRRVLRFIQRGWGRSAFIVIVDILEVILSDRYGAELWAGVFITLCGIQGKRYRPFPYIRLLARAAAISVPMSARILADDLLLYFAIKYIMIVKNIIIKFIICK